MSSAAVDEINGLLDDLDFMENEWAVKETLTDAGVCEHLDRWSAVAEESIRQRVSDEEASNAHGKFVNLWEYVLTYDDPDDVHFECHFEVARAYLQALRGAVLKYPHLLRNVREPESTAPSVSTSQASSLAIQLDDEERKALLETLKLVWEFEWALKLNRFVRNLVRGGCGWVKTLLALTASVFSWVVSFPIHLWRWARDEQTLPLWQPITAALTALAIVVAVVLHFV
jgi:hypothetical protein